MNVEATSPQAASAGPSFGATQSSTSDTQWWELQYDLRTRQRQVFDWRHLSILSDGRCIGACSLFTMMLQQVGLASTFLIGPTQIASHSPSGVSQRLSRQYCQWYNGAIGFPGNLDYNITSSNPSYPLARMSASMTSTCRSLDRTPTSLWLRCAIQFYCMQIVDM